ncbi:Rossmann-like domain-containing protein [Paenibacillus whitsoniae]|uniref:Putative heavy-metal chelation domain-containing protein n=1 Tax=Paenibacillus whitsoniae TaxID=2496558 RepID=A0A3S0BYA7_9BACL|nr:DUF364 domain-containing protein [Paenibacillus whitsoniae]RTE11018.1 hypothetical protein EJQ19_04615 [Paenibacillus whitsoniae]
MINLQTQAPLAVINLREAILEGKLGPKPDTLPVTGSSYIYQTTQFPSSTTKYHNYYLLLRVESYFGACSHTSAQLNMEVAAEFSGLFLDAVLQDERLPAQIAAMDAYLGVIYPHITNCTKVVELSAGTPIHKAKQRDALIAQVADIRPSQKVALIGVVNPLVEAIQERGGICLPCDLQMEKTQAGHVVEKDMNIVLDQADSVICTAMTLSNGTFDLILERVRERQIPLTVYAQTGSAVVAQFMNNGVTALIAEPFPFTQFSGSSSQLYCYTSNNGKEETDEY